MYYGIDELKSIDKDQLTHKKSDFHQDNKKLIYLYKVKKDLNAREKLILNNINLVRKIAFKKSKISSFTYEDLVQEGIMGLIKGIDKFDMDRNTEFSTYAYYWINQCIDRAIYDRGFVIRLPIYVIEKINKINKIEKQYVLRCGRVNEEGLCRELGISLKEYKEMKVYDDKIKKIMSLNQSILSEDGNEDSELLDIIPYSYKTNLYENGEDINVEDIVFSKFLRIDIEKVLSTLTPREESIIRDRFGLFEKKPKTLEEIGSYYNVTRERIRQIEVKAIRKLKHPSRAKCLKDYF